MNYLGDFKAAATVVFAFSTNDGDGGAVAPSSAFENADLKIYKNSSATERSSVSGITMTSPFDSTTGLHHVAIDLNDNDDAGFWAAGTDYIVVLSPDETVDGETVVAVIAQFSIENRFAGSSIFEKAAKMLINKAVQNKSTGAIEYYDDDGSTVLLTHTPSDSDTEVTRTPS